MGLSTQEPSWIIKSMGSGRITGRTEGRKPIREPYPSSSLCIFSTYQGDVLRGRRHGTGVFRHGQKSLTYEGDWNMGNIHGKVPLNPVFHRKLQSISFRALSNSTRKARITTPVTSSTTFPLVKVVDSTPRATCTKACGSMANGTGTESSPGVMGMESTLDNGKTVFRFVRYFHDALIWVRSVVQNGPGIHVWYIIRAEESQYALRNYYEGMFLNGRRHGHGTFYYSSGTKYTGEWKGDQKHGKVSSDR